MNRPAAVATDGPDNGQTEDVDGGDKAAIQSSVEGGFPRHYTQQIVLAHDEGEKKVPADGELHVVHVVAYHEPSAAVAVDEVAAGVIDTAAAAAVAAADVVASVDTE